MTTTITYSINGMHCNACVQRVSAALRGLASSVEVTLQPPLARLVVEGAAPDDAQVAAVVSAAGKYSATRVESTADAPAASRAPEVAPPAAATIATVPITRIQRAPARVAAPPAITEKPTTYYPLILVVGVLLAATLARHATAWDSHAWMRDFMGGFFVAFAFFKLLDVAAFANAFAGYDLIAARFPAYGRAYPFIELALGLAYLANVAPLAVNGITLVLMLVGTIGVAQTLLAKKTIQCACLGTAFNLPMSKVTLVENLGMAAMAAGALIHLAGY